MSQPSTATDVVTPEEQEEDYDIPEEVETVIGQFLRLINEKWLFLQYLCSGHQMYMFLTEHLLVGLKDKETIVRWSAAKGSVLMSSKPILLITSLITVVDNCLRYFTFQHCKGDWEASEGAGR